MSATDENRLAVLKEARAAVYAEFEGKPVPASPLESIDRAGRAIGRLINAIEYPDER